MQSRPANKQDMQLDMSHTNNNNQDQVSLNNSRFSNHRIIQQANSQQLRAQAMQDASGVQHHQNGQPASSAKTDVKSPPWTPSKSSQTILQPPSNPGSNSKSTASNALRPAHHQGSQMPQLNQSDQQCQLQILNYLLQPDCGDLDTLIKQEESF